MTATTTTDLRVPDEVLRLLSLCTGDEKHSSAATSPLDVEWVLYDRVLRLRPDTVDDPDRDRFILSKGHGPAGYYAVLAAKGYLDPALLPGFLGVDSPLGGHPDRLRIPGVEASTGSLGHGLPPAVGVSLGLRARRSTAHTYVLCGAAVVDGRDHDPLDGALRRRHAGRPSLVVADVRGRAAADATTA